MSHPTPKRCAYISAFCRNGGIVELVQTFNCFDIEVVAPNDVAHTLRESSCDVTSLTSFNQHWARGIFLESLDLIIAGVRPTASPTTAIQFGVLPISFVVANLNFNIVPGGASEPGEKVRKFVSEGDHRILDLALAAAFNPTQVSLVIGKRSCISLKEELVRLNGTTSLEHRMNAASRALHQISIELNSRSTNLQQVT